MDARGTGRNAMALPVAAAADKRDAGRTVPGTPLADAGWAGAEPRGAPNACALLRGSGDGCTHSDRRHDSAYLVASGDAFLRHDQTCLEYAVHHIPFFVQTFPEKCKNSNLRKRILIPCVSCNSTKTSKRKPANPLYGPADSRHPAPAQ